MYWILVLIAILSVNGHDQCSPRSPCGWDICHENRVKQLPGYACNKCIYCDTEKVSAPKPTEYCQVINNQCVYKLNDKEFYECIQKITVPTNFIPVGGTKSNDAAHFYTWIYSQDTDRQSTKMQEKFNNGIRSYSSDKWNKFVEDIKKIDPPKSVVDWIELRKTDPNADLDYNGILELGHALENYFSTKSQRDAICNACKAHQKHVDRIKCVVNQIHDGGIVSKSICGDCDSCSAVAKKTLTECFSGYYKDGLNIKLIDKKKSGYGYTHTFLVITDIQIDGKKSNLYIECNKKKYVQETLEGAGGRRRILTDTDEDNCSTQSAECGIDWDCDSCVMQPFLDIVPDMYFAICNQPTVNPTLSPTTDPTLSPTTDPTLSPTTDPTLSPTTDPTLSPTTDPTTSPTTDPTKSRTSDPTVATWHPTGPPTKSPSTDPTKSPSTDPTESPTSDPTKSSPPSACNLYGRDIDVIILNEISGPFKDENGRPKTSEFRKHQNMVANTLKRLKGSYDGNNELPEARVAYIEYDDDNVHVVIPMNYEPYNQNDDGMDGSSLITDEQIMEYYNLIKERYDGMTDQDLQNKICSNNIKLFTALNEARNQFNLQPKGIDKGRDRYIIIFSNCKVSDSEKYNICDEFEDYIRSGIDNADRGANQNGKGINVVMINMGHQFEDYILCLVEYDDKRIYQSNYRNQQEFEQDGLDGTIVNEICKNHPTAGPTTDPTIDPTSDPTKQPITTTEEQQEAESIFVQNDNGFLDKLKNINNNNNNDIWILLTMMVLIVMVFMNIICCNLCIKNKAINNNKKIYNAVDMKEYDVEISDENIPIYH